jgi:hypothetical protein
MMDENDVAPVIGVDVFPLDTWRIPRAQHDIRLAAVAPPHVSDRTDLLDGSLDVCTHYPQEYAAWRYVGGYEKAWVSFTSTVCEHGHAPRVIAGDAEVRVERDLMSGLQLSPYQRGFLESPFAKAPSEYPGYETNAGWLREVFMYDWSHRYADTTANEWWLDATRALREHV